MQDIAADSRVGSPTSQREVAAKSYLYGPLVDFLCLGGGSLLILFPMFLLLSAEMRPSLVVASLFASYLVNQPHFAHSYQIFYRDFRAKLLSEAYPGQLRVRYALAGIIVPVTMVLYFLVCAILEDARLLALSVNVLALTVGWHYVKQGYGILMVECVLKRCFFNDRDKARLKFNAYSVWIFSWVFTNVAFHQSQFMDLTYYSFNLPPWLLALTGFIALASTLVILFTFTAKARSNGGRLPYNGIAAYVASVYVWIYAVYTDPLLVLVVPAFHSIQYLAVVWRFQLNRARAELGPDARDYQLLGGRIQLPRHVARLIRFIVIGGVLGAIGFHAAPYLLSAGAPDQVMVFGPTMLFLMFWTFFNVHHYFLDNVMWRKENPDVKRHLFTPA